MPINFEPAAPTGNAAAASYGAAQQNAQDIGATANLYEAAARMQMQNQQLQQAGQEAQQRGNAAAAAAQLEDRHQQQAFAGQQDQTALGYAALQARGEEIDRHAQAQAWVSKQDMTYADQLRMNRMQQGVSEVEDAFQQGKIDRDTYTSAVLQIKTGLDPLRMKYEQQQTAHLQKQNEMIDSQMQRQAAHEATAREFEAKMMTGGQEWAWYPDDNGKRHPLVKNAKTGEWYNPLLSNGGNGGGGKADAALQQEDFKLTQAAITKYHELQAKAVDQTTRYVADAKRGNPGAQVESWENLMGQARRDLKADMPLADFVAQYRALHGAKPQAAGAAGGDLGGGGDYGGGPTSPPPSPAPPPVPEAESKPFDLTKPDAMHPKQRAVVDVIWNARNAAVAASPAQAERWTKEAEWARATVAKYGNYYKIPDAERAHYDRVLEELGRGAAAAPPAAGRAGLTGPPGTGPIERVQRLAAAVSPAFN